MAETLTYEEAPKEQFSEEELDSIKVGEEIEVQQDNLLAGKYKDAEELEKAYLELQTKLGEKPSEDKVEEPEPENQTEPEIKEEEDKPEEGPNILDRLWDQRDDGFNEETLKELSETNPGDLAKMYLLYRNQQIDQNTPKSFTESDINNLQGIAGGNESYKNMMNWAQSNLTEQEAQMYDSIMDSGDANAAYFAVQAINARYKDNVGTDLNLLTGKAPKAAGDQFKRKLDLTSLFLSFFFMIRNQY